MAHTFLESGGVQLSFAFGEYIPVRRSLSKVGAWRGTRRTVDHVRFMPFWRKVILFLPPYSGKLLGAPLGLLSLAGSLRAAGYIPQIIDGALDRDYMKTIAAHAGDCACLGV